MYVHWSFKGFVPSILFGFILALILEGFLLIGGRTLFTELLGWENAPKPVAVALDAGRTRLVNVLGVQTSEIPDTLVSEGNTVESVSSGYQSLPLEAQEELTCLLMGRQPLSLMVIRDCKLLISAI